MNIAMMCSMNTYTQNMKMQMKWKERQSSGNYVSKSGRETVSDAEKLLRERQEKATDLFKQNTSSVSREQIDAKMRSGKRLSAAEMEYLKEHDPQTYQKAREIEMEREAYERELKRCRTKEEVQRVKLSHAAASMAAVKEADTNPNIPEGQKLALVMQELAKSNALGEVERTFIKSGGYQALPSENERLKAEKDLKEAEEAEKGIDDKTDDTPEETVDSCQKEAAEHSAEEKALSRKGKREPTEAEQRKAREIAGGREMTRLEAEVTPEARKVRRAKAQAAYAGSSMAYTGGDSSSAGLSVSV